MSIKVSEIASKLNMKDSAVIEILSDLGIGVEDSNSVLTDKDIQKINTAIASMNRTKGSSSKYDTNAFSLVDRVTSIPNDEIKISKLPKEGDFLFDKQSENRQESFLSSVKHFFFGGEETKRSDEKRHKIKLIKKLGSGGEAAVYTTDTQYVAKIYHMGKLNKRKKAKLDLMISKHLSYPGICYPICNLYNANNEFVGYLMPKAEGTSLQSSLVNRARLRKLFPHWRKRDLVELAITILTKFSYLHKHNIVLGDINPFNILVKSSKEVYLVDTDSYQIAGFPCPVGTITFTPQEVLLANKEYKQRYHESRTYDQYLRSFATDNFAIAVLLFFIVMSGKNPYALQGGDSIEENMLAMDFSYALDDVVDEKTPKGSWGFIWSHLPYFIKQDFYNTFHHDGKLSTAKTRLSVDTWLAHFKRYLMLLDNGSLGKQDMMSEVLFPTRYKNIVVKIHTPKSIWQKIVDFFKNLFNN